jgi:hypothetical protein
MVGQPAEKLGRLDGVLEHAQRIAFQVPLGELLVEGTAPVRRAARLILEGMPDQNELRDLKAHARDRLEETTRRVAYVDQGKFQPVEGTEFDQDFGIAVRGLLDFYSTSYFGFKNREQPRHCAASRILEVTDERYVLADDVSAAETLRMTFHGLSETEIEETLRSIVSIEEDS